MTKLPYFALGFTAARRKALEGLKGDIQHEARAAHEEKNLLATGEVSVAIVAKLLASCSGAQYRSSGHFNDPRTEVHEFYPGRGLPGEPRWYIKLYFRKGITFMSVHR